MRETKRQRAGTETRWVEMLSDTYDTWMRSGRNLLLVVFVVPALASVAILLNEDYRAADLDFDVVLGQAKQLSVDAGYDGHKVDVICEGD